MLLKTSRDVAGSRAHSRELFERELEIARELDARGALAALELVEGSDGAVLVLADAPGMSLDRILDRGAAPLPLTTSLKIAVELAATLSDLHLRDLLHRDLRPANVLYDEAGGRVHLTGLGQAARVPRGAWGIRPPERLVGDPTYLAPEATGRLNRQLDYRADFYSLGIVLFEMLAGRPPFDDTDPVALVHAHIALEPPDLDALRRVAAVPGEPGLPIAVSAIVAKLLAKAAEDRYQSVHGLRHDLERCLADLESGREIHAFEPGERDLAERFELPQTLFGREAELRWLEEGLAAAAGGRRLIRLVAGYSGVGKTSLVEEIRLAVLRQRGLFASGTFDRRSKTLPYQGVLDVLRGLVSQKLGSKPENISRWSARLQEKLGDQLGIMTDALPELLSVVEEPPPAPEVQSEIARNRFYMSVERFLATLIPTDDQDGGNAPLVLFLDDLQWADPASLQLLRSLLAGDEGAYLVLGTYRDNEIDEDHLLLRILASLSKRGIDVDTLRLAPLAEGAIAGLVAETLHLPPSDIAPLAELIYRKTAGNPFFARSFLSTLYRRRLLRFTTPPGDTRPRWAWDLAEVAELEATENVVELVGRQLAELPDAARRVVTVASVLGKEFDARTLAAIHGPEESTAPADREETEELLFEACRQGLLLKAGPSYAFVHDRVREGAYDLLGEDERTDVHLRAGRHLRDLAGPRQGAGTSRDFFKIADHLNLAACRLTDPEERRDLAWLNGECGRQARESGAFTTAHTYFGNALEHLHLDNGSDPWHETYELAQALYAGAAEAASLTGDFTAAESLAETLHRNARELLHEVPAYETQIYVHFARREVEAAIQLALEVLGRLGFELALEPSEADLRTAIESAREVVETARSTAARQGVQKLPAMRDPRRLAASRFLVRIVFFAAWSRVRLLLSAICRMAELTARHGVGPDSPLALVSMSYVYFGELEDTEGARHVGEFGLALAEHPAATGAAAICQIAFDVLLGGRTLHPTVLRERFARHFDRAQASGDQVMVGTAALQHSVAGLLAGVELSQAETSAREYHQKMENLGQMVFASTLGVVQRLIGVLRGRGTVEEAVTLPDVAAGALGNIRDRVVGPEMMVRFLLRQRSALDTARESLPMPNGTLPLFPFDFYRCLIFLDAAIGDGDPGVGRRDLDACRARLESLARSAPELYQHKLDLVKAHEKRAGGETSEALAIYEQAISGARKSGFPHEAALARELAAELSVELGDARGAAAYLREAAASYERWGATAKIDQLFERYPDLLAPPGDPSKSLDVTSLERAQSVLASELDLDRLLRGLMTLLLQNAGASRGFLLRVEGGGRRSIVIEARGVDGEVDLPEGLTLDGYGEIATTAVHFVARTQEVLAVGDATRDARLASDPWVEKARVLSLLCFPLRQRGHTVEIVYLENDRSPDVFSSERTASLRLLASHATAALENARLFQSLKREVEIRRQAEAELAALKDRLLAENVYLQEEIQSHFEEIVGQSDAMRKVLYKVEQVAATDATVLILGETGTGKELIARALHQRSGRRERPLVKVNCAALPATLIESELFGHEKGAFTGALSRKVGRFELADSGTLFLDEIGDLPLELQAKLLRVLQEGELERLGSTKTLKVDVRIIAATNHDLETAIADGTFRSDLYYRLGVFPIELPPLRERAGDVPLLVRYFVGRKQAKLGKSIAKIPQEAMDRLDAYSWPGNARELENVVERALILSPGDTFYLDESFGPRQASSGSATLPSAIADEPTPAPSGVAMGPAASSATVPRSSQPLVEVERAHVLEVLEVCGWKIKGKGNAAERLGLKPPTLRNRMKKLGIVRPDA